MDEVYQRLNNWTCLQ